MFGECSSRDEEHAALGVDPDQDIRSAFAWKLVLSKPGLGG